MRKWLSSLLLLAFIGIMSGCGGQPTPESSSHETRFEPAVTPTPLPTRSVPSRGFDAAALESEFRISRSGAFWVQLDHRSIEKLVIVVGIEPSKSGADLDQEVADHREEFSHTRGHEYHESGSVDTATLGRALWSWGSFDDEGRKMEQLVLFAAHPDDGCLVIARAEFPAAGDPIQPHLDQLVEIAGIVGPGL